MVYFTGTILVRPLTPLLRALLSDLLELLYSGCTQVYSINKKQQGVSTKAKRPSFQAGQKNKYRVHTLYVHTVLIASIPKSMNDISSSHLEC